MDDTNDPETLKKVSHELIDKDVTIINCTILPDIVFIFYYFKFF